MSHKLFDVGDIYYLKCSIDYFIYGDIDYFIYEGRLFVICGIDISHIWRHIIARMGT